MFDNPRNAESQCYDCIFISEEFSVLRCLKTIKIIFLSPELMTALPLIAVGLLDTRDFI